MRAAATVAPLHPQAAAAQAPVALDAGRDEAQRADATGAGLSATAPPPQRQWRLRDAPLQPRSQTLFGWKTVFRPNIDYAAAGVLPFAYKEDMNELFVLLSVQQETNCRVVTFLGGKRAPVDCNDSRVTAAREAFEETHRLLRKTDVQDTLRAQLAEYPTTSGSSASDDNADGGQTGEQRTRGPPGGPQTPYAHYQNGRYTLFAMHLPDAWDLPTRFAAKVEARDIHPEAEKAVALEWVPVRQLANPISLSEALEHTAAGGALRPHHFCGALLWTSHGAKSKAAVAWLWDLEDHLRVWHGASRVAREPMFMGTMQEFKALTKGSSKPNQSPEAAAPDAQATAQEQSTATSAGRRGGPEPPPAPSASSMEASGVRNAAAHSTQPHATAQASGAPGDAPGGVQPQPAASFYAYWRVDGVPELRYRDGSVRPSAEGSAPHACSSPSAHPSATCSAGRAVATSDNTAEAASARPAASHAATVRPSSTEAGPASTAHGTGAAGASPASEATATEATPAMPTRYLWRMDGSAQVYMPQKHADAAPRSRA